jgi:Asp-tRNA(Asn)/Glu-tRNA(Gln) amidotransferase B subunit
MNDEPKAFDIRHVVDVDFDVAERQSGHREIYNGQQWVRVLHSEWVRCGPWWLAQSPVEVMKCVGIETTLTSAKAFNDASDNDFSSLHYLAIAARNDVGEEALKWVMSNMAAELNARKLTFTDLPVLLPAMVLNTFLVAMKTGIIDRSFAKPIFAELLKCTFGLGADGTVEIDKLITDPRFKAADENVIDKAIDEVIAANPEQYEKAKENPKLVQWFVGQVMKATQGKAKPPVIIEKMNARLSA